MQFRQIQFSGLALLSTLLVVGGSAAAFAQAAGTPGAPSSGGTGNTNGIGPAPQPTPGQVTSVPPPSNTSPGMGPAPQPTPGQVTNVPSNPSGSTTGSGPR
jgi:hypothetical protein